MGKRKNLCLYNVILIILFCIFAIFSCFLMYKTQYLFGAGDMQFHLKRIMELEASFKNGHILPLYSFNQFHGSAILSLYPYLNLFPIFILSYFIKSNIALIYIFFAFTIFLSLLFSYYGSLVVSQSKKTSFTFSIIYSLSISFLAYGFYNMDLGALTSIAVLPLVLFGFFNLLINNRYLELVMGLTLLIYSHVLSTIIIIGLLILLVIINFITNREMIMTRHFWYGIIKTVVLTVLLTSIVWIPAITLSINNIGSIYPPGPINLTKIGLFSVLRNAIFGNITYNLGLISLVGIVLPIIIKSYKIITKSNNKIFGIYTKQMYFIALFVIIICGFFPWNLINNSSFRILRMFQFTWRFYIIPNILLSYVFAVCVTKCVNNKVFENLLIAISIIIAIIFQLRGQQFLINESINSPSFTKNYVNGNIHKSKADFHHISLNVSQFQFTYYKNPRYPYYKVTNDKQLRRLTNTYTDENTPDYYPIKALSKVNYINNNKATYVHNRTINVRHTGYNRFSFDSPKRINRLALPLLHYKGEHLRVYVNHHLVHSHTNGNSLVTLDNVKKGRNVVGVRSVPNVWIVALKCVLFLIGMVWLFLTLFRHLESKFMKRNILLSSSITLTIVLGIVYAFIKGGWPSIISLIINILVAAIFYLLGQTTLSKRISQDYIIL